MAGFGLNQKRYHARMGVVSHAGVSKNGRVPVHMAEEIRTVDVIWELDVNSHDFAGEISCQHMSTPDQKAPGQLMLIGPVSRISRQFLASGGSSILSP